MASSSHNNFEGSFDESFDQYFDQLFDQTFENLINDQEDERKTRKNRVFIEGNREEGHIRLWNDFSVTLQHILKIYSDDDLE